MKHFKQKCVLHSWHQLNTFSKFILTKSLFVNFRERKKRFRFDFVSANAHACVILTLPPPGVWLAGGRAERGETTEPIRWVADSPNHTRDGCGASGLRRRYQPGGEQRAWQNVVHKHSSPVKLSAHKFRKTCSCELLSCQLRTPNPYVIDRISRSW